MIYSIEVPDYTPVKGVSLVWEEGCSISVTIRDNNTVISANTVGLITLARHILALAQKEAPGGCHVHYDSESSLEDGSSDLIIEKR